MIVTDSNNYLIRSSIEHLSPWEAIISRLIKSYGEYLVIRDENGINYLEYFTFDGTSTGNKLVCTQKIEFLSTWEVITSKLLKTHGWYLVVKEIGVENVFDYVEDFTDTGYKDGNKLVCTQKIEFGANFLDLTEKLSGADIKMGIIPLGARLEDSGGNQTDEYLIIESLPDEILSEGILKAGDHILNTTLAETYGAIYDVIKWEDVKIVENLQDKALS